MNLQPLKYFIANRDSAAAILQKATKMGGRLPERHLPDAGKEPESYIVILQDPDISTSDTFTNIDLGIAAQADVVYKMQDGTGGRMLKSLKQLLRTPMKTCLFFLLMTAATALLVLGAIVGHRHRRK